MNSEQVQEAPGAKPRIKLPPKAVGIAKITAMHKKGVIATKAAAAEVGDVMEDGTIYAGVSPTTHKRMFVASADASLRKTFNQAVDYAASLKIGGHNDFRLPDKDELNVIFGNKDKGALKNSFRLTTGVSASWYCSSTPEGNDKAWVQLFVAGQQIADSRDNRSWVRCVRFVS